jgi:uncharacterized protein YjbI with pentapeptide repeats
MSARHFRGNNVEQQLLTLILTALQGSLGSEQESLPGVTGYDRRTPPVGVSLRGVHLTGVHLTGVHLTGVHLTGLYLTGVHLTCVHLTGVHLTGVHLTDVHLTGVYLVGVSLILRINFKRSFPGKALYPRT